ncbi:aminotransferase class V-fold PLP-dependent enzyme [Staphylococcus condimenti]|uniref:Aminotransferase class V-fold PLP-dependent enzyme n=1 Tax=Staphylococcus condimenti TaxID=70255 RepID=A0A143P9J9_9STAP|nr:MULTISPECIES: aminotransferase class V-fold PLP-dependent enzyme [Staphylococcus]AMY04479.1 cysteine desulfurase [Staphylococcus condimenti]APR60716.1 cysteine desulfurase [Staphylococcus condimenti]MDK8646295.1 aminotransferase class V-fold PLP-dependent enzyme [Staphylococcus condimenti]OFP01724.1 cysteine desulfurase [Staphylococcus sp. HMSC065E08]PNZ58950.1 aminotransferase class V-fold PLP-dependent enzyme [Staphylococcus condimenti]
MIYLDNASTTQPSKEVLDIYQEAQQALFYNSESLHAGGEMVREALNSSRKFIQEHFNTKKEVIFTTSGSHANQIAISTYLQQAPEGRVIVSPYEHPSIAAALEPFRKQFEIVEMSLSKNGEIDLQGLKSLITDETVLLIAQHVSSETGYKLPVNEIAMIGETQNIPIHVDGVQAVHKISDIDIEKFTSYTFSGHKFNGTKGSGVLLIEHKSVRPINIHYFHEEGTRNGTLDVPSILAMTKALSLNPQYEHLLNLYQYALKRAKRLGFTILEYDLHAPHILGMLTPLYEGQYVMQTLSSRNICISTGTACGHGLLLSDGLLKKIETTSHEADQYVRVSLSKNTTINELEQCFDQLENILKEVALDEPS